jgi:hypothetical protein
LPHAPVKRHGQILDYDQDAFLARWRRHQFFLQASL